MEYPKQENPDKQPEQMMAALKHSIEHALEMEFEVSPGAWVELDSSTPYKFSRHLLLPDVSLEEATGFNIWHSDRMLCDSGRLC